MSWQPSLHHFPIQVVSSHIGAEIQSFDTEKQNNTENCHEPTMWLVATPEVVIPTHSGAVNDDKVIATIFGWFLCYGRKPKLHNQWPVTTVVMQHISLRWTCCHFGEIVVIVCKGSCHFDNFQCNQLQQFRQNDRKSVLVNKSPWCVYATCFKFIIVSEDIMHTRFNVTQCDTGTLFYIGPAQNRPS